MHEDEDEQDGEEWYDDEEWEDEAMSGSAITRSRFTLTSPLARSWTLSAAMDREEDVSVESAFVACCIRTRKGGLSRLSPLERRMMESFKVLLWGYVADPTRLSMRHLKVNTAIDELVRAESTSSEDDVHGMVVDEKAGEASSSSAANLTGVNLSDGLVVDGYQFLIKHLVSEPLKDESIPAGVKGTTQGSRRQSADGKDRLLEGTGAGDEGLSCQLDVTLGAPVTEVHHGEDGASVILADGTVEHCDMVVVTVPLGVLKRSASEGGIDFSPPLCEAKQQAIHSLGMGTENKIVLLWAVEDIFWPASAPYLQCTDPRFRFLNGDYFGKPGLLVALVAPPYAEEMEELDDEIVLHNLLGVLRAAFVPNQGSLPALLDWRITRWGKDPYSFGSYSYDKLGSLLSQRPTLRAPEIAPGSSIPRLFFAGEACSSDAPQCVHGAVETGYMAADEVLRALTMRAFRDDAGLQDALDGCLDGSPIICKCRSLFDPCRVMVRCSGCAMHYHDDCVGVLCSGDNGIDDDEEAAAPNADASERFLCVACSNQ